MRAIAAVLRAQLQGACAVDQRFLEATQLGQQGAAVEEQFGVGRRACERTVDFLQRRLRTALAAPHLSKDGVGFRAAWVDLQRARGQASRLFVAALEHQHGGEVGQHGHAFGHQRQRLAVQGLGLVQAAALVVVQGREEQVLGAFGGVHRWLGARFEAD